MFKICRKRLLPNYNRSSSRKEILPEPHKIYPRVTCLVAQLQQWVGKPDFPLTCCNSLISLAKFNHFESLSEKALSGKY